MLVFLQRNLVWMLLSLALSATLWTVVTTQQNPDVSDVFPKVNNSSSRVAAAVFLLIRIAA